MDIILPTKALVMADLKLIFTYTVKHYTARTDLCFMLNTINVVTETELVDGD